MFGIKCLKMINFDRDQLTDRRRQAECDIKVYSFIHCRVGY